MSVRAETDRERSRRRYAKESMRDVSERELLFVNEGSI